MQIGGGLSPLKRWTDHIPDETQIQHFFVINRNLFWNGVASCVGTQSPVASQSAFQAE
jgi:hypothetical protein